MWGAVTLFFVACPMIVSGCVEFLSSYTKKVDEPITKYDVAIFYQNGIKQVSFCFIYHLKKYNFLIIIYPYSDNR